MYVYAFELLQLYIFYFIENYQFNNYFREMKTITIILKMKINLKNIDVHLNLNRIFILFYSRAATVKKYLIKHFFMDDEMFDM